MSNGYINTLEYISDRINNLSLETQEKYFLEKLDLLLKYIKEKLEIYSDSKVLLDAYIALVKEFKSIIEKSTEQANKELLFNISSDIREELEKLDKNYIN